VHEDGAVLLLQIPQLAFHVILVIDAVEIFARISPIGLFVGVGKTDSLRVTAMMGPGDFMVLLPMTSILSPASIIRGLGIEELVLATRVADCRLVSFTLDIVLEKKMVQTT